MTVEMIVIFIVSCVVSFGVTTMIFLSVVDRKISIENKKNFIKNCQLYEQKKRLYEEQKLYNKWCKKI